MAIAVTKYFVKCGLPFAHAEQEGFQEFVEELGKKFHTGYLTSNRIGTDFLPILYNNLFSDVEGAMKNALVDTKGIAFTADLWTSR